MKGEQIVTDESPFAGGSVNLIYHGEDGVRSRGTVALVNATTPVRTYSEIFYVDETVSSIAVALRLARAKGILSVQDPELSVLAAFPVYKTTRTILAAIWSFFTFFLVFWAARNLPLNTLLLAGALLAVTVAGVLMPGGIITAVSKSIFSSLPQGGADFVEAFLEFFFGAGSAKPWIGISKLAHFLGFVLIGGLVGRSYRRVGVVFAIASVVVFATVTECLQTLVFGRSSSLRDIYIDSLGGVFGALSVVIYLRSTGTGVMSSRSESASVQRRNPSQEW
jgi:hypothetical protein